jgi:hypothetical protein
MGIRIPKQSYLFEPSCKMPLIEQKYLWCALRQPREAFYSRLSNKVKANGEPDWPSAVENDLLNRAPRGLNRGQNILESGLLKSRCCAGVLGSLAGDGGCAAALGLSSATSAPRVARPSSRFGPQLDGRTDIRLVARCEARLLGGPLSAPSVSSSVWKTTAAPAGGASSPPRVVH